LKFHLCIYALEFDHEVFTTVEAVIFNTEFDDFRQIALQFIERCALRMCAAQTGNNPDIEIDLGDVFDIGGEVGRFVLYFNIDKKQFLFGTKFTAA